MKNRVITAFVLIAIFLPAMLIGGIITKTIFCIVLGLCVDELTSFRRNNWNPLIQAYFLISFIGLCFLSWQIYPWILFLFCFSLFVLSFVDSRFELIDVLLYSTMAIILTTAGRSAFGFLEKGNLYMVYIACVTYSVDTGGFFGGKFFGKHKLIERISPKKTWEGAIVGYLAGFAVSLVYHYFWGVFAWPTTLMLSVVLAATGQLGDLVFSTIKRQFDIKDFGSLLPGHGGILDRIDSLLINICMMTLIMVLFA